MKNRILREYIESLKEDNELDVSGSAFIPLQSSHLFVPLHHSFKNT